MEMGEHSQNSNRDNHGSLEDVQLRSTSRPFAQWNLILEHVQHSKTLLKQENMTLLENNAYVFVF